MAGCYHDKQEFNSDLNIEVAREADILEACQELTDRTCDKNPGHEGFIPLKDLSLEHLPIEDRNREILDNIKNMGRRIVKLVVDKIENGGWIKESGSGHVVKFDNEYRIMTNNHVVNTDDKVKQCTVDFHYDDDSRSDVLTSRGVKLVASCPYRDIALFTFHPIPDFLYQQDFAHAMQPCIVILYKNNEITTAEPIQRSPPSQISFLSPRHLNSSLIELMFMSWPDGSISYLKSSYIEFQPIFPSNTKDLFSTMVLCCNMINYSIEIHIDEDDDNRRVISGDVETVGGESVINTSESIFQDEVKKCRLVCNGEVIGRGTRLYFPQVKSSDIHFGVDLERDTNLGREYYCILEFSPLPRFVEAKLNRSNIICCIGHPHGGIKMVTFGRCLEVSPEQFDNQYRRISQPNPNSQCHVVSCMKYSCKTCPGSSGSPVFRLFEWMDWRNSSIHFMGEKVEIVLPNGERIENINIARAPYSHV